MRIAMRKWIVIQGVALVVCAFAGQRHATAATDNKWNVTAVNTSPPSPSPAFDGLGGAAAEEVDAGVSATTGTPAPRSEGEIIAGPWFDWNVVGVKYQTVQNGPWQTAPAAAYSCTIDSCTVNTDGSYNPATTVRFKGLVAAWWQVTVGVNGTYDGSGPSGNIADIWCNADKPANTTLATFVTGHWDYSKTKDPYTQTPPSPFDDEGSALLPPPGASPWTWSTLCHPDFCKADFVGLPGGPWDSQTTLTCYSHQGELKRELVWYPIGSTAINTNINWTVSASIGLAYTVDATNPGFGGLTGQIGAASGMGSVLVTPAMGGGSSPVNTESGFSESITNQGNQGATTSVGVDTNGTWNISSTGTPPPTVYNKSGNPAAFAGPIPGNGYTGSSGTVYLQTDLNANASVYWWSGPNGPEHGHASAQITGGYQGLTMAPTLVPRHS
jgi:hypothetical protein